MPGEYRWVAQMASRENRKGRTKGVRKSLVGEEEEQEEEVDVIVTQRIVMGKD